MASLSERFLALVLIVTQLVWRLDLCENIKCTVRYVDSVNVQYSRMSRIMKSKLSLYFPVMHNDIPPQCGMSFAKTIRTILLGDAC